MWLQSISRLAPFLLNFAKSYLNIVRSSATRTQHILLGSTCPAKGEKLKIFITACAAGLFMVLGIIGLVIPVLPGVIFLLLAAVCIASLSHRAKRQFERHPRLHRFFQRLDAGRGLDLTSRTKLAFWASLEAANPKQEKTPQKTHWSKPIHIK